MLALSSMAFALAISVASAAGHMSDASHAAASPSSKHVLEPTAQRPCPNCDAGRCCSAIY
jgi:hypothetical protein